MVFAFGPRQSKEAFRVRPLGSTLSGRSLPATWMLANIPIWGALLPSKSAIASGRLGPKLADVLSATNQSSPGTVGGRRSGGNIPPARRRRDRPARQLFSGTPSATPLIITLPEEWPTRTMSDRSSSSTTPIAS
jgi:hypothetical protein